MGYMRIHTAIAVYSISLIWGRDSGHVGRLVHVAVKSIGAAMRDLSLLDIDKDFLDATRPQQYKGDKGLKNCCAVPDGKDFKIFTSLKNTIFTRASYSDKVLASTLRCILWSIPHGLSFEHTRLFLARSSEKTLVGFLAKKLKKCPRGMFVLSDHSFFDTVWL